METWVVTTQNRRFLRRGWISWRRRGCDLSMRILLVGLHAYSLRITNRTIRWRTRLQRNVLGPWDKPLIAADRLTVGQLLQQHGYDTHASASGTRSKLCNHRWETGKWWSQKRTQQRRFQPTDRRRPVTRGFDHYFGTIVPNYPPYCFIENDRTFGIPSIPMSGANFNIPGPTVLVEAREYPTRTDQPCSKVDRERAKAPKAVFSLPCIDFSALPSGARFRFCGETNVGAYGDFVYQTDWSIGQVLDAIERAGIQKNTLIIFTSDNGSESPVKCSQVSMIECNSSIMIAQADSAARNAMRGKVGIAFHS